MARIKSEDTRFKILKSALNIFKKKGYADTSMDAISDLSKISKATLYNYFKSKEELFLSVMIYEMEQQNGPPPVDLFEKYDFFEALTILGRLMIKSVYSKNIMDTRRMLIANASYKQLGKLCYETGPKKVEAKMISVFKEAIDRGVLINCDPYVFEAHFRTLVESEFTHIFIFSLENTINEKWIAEAVDRAIFVLKKAYSKE